MCAAEDAHLVAAARRREVLPLSVLHLKPVCPHVAKRKKEKRISPRTYRYDRVAKRRRFRGPTRDVKFEKRIMNLSLNTVER